MPEPKYVSDLAFTPSVKAEQEKRGSRAVYQKAIERRDWQNTLDDVLKTFIAERDSFYLATAAVGTWQLAQFQVLPAADPFGVLVMHQFNVEAVPEPGSLLLAAVVTLAAVCLDRRR